MSTHIALLRGVNLGRHNRIAMSRLRDLVAGLGYSDVRTHLQSGNALFTSSDSPAGSARAIERGIAEQLSLTVPVVVRIRDELAAVIAADPLRAVADDPAGHLVTFLSERPDPALVEGIDPAAHLPDVFRFQDREIHLWCPHGVRASKLGQAFWEKHLKVTATARNWRTSTALLELADS